jgi:mannosyltransferase OCH1-like enzyme
MIPKIIHQTGPDESKWHPIWKECSESWKNTFPDFQYMYWTDDDLRNLVRDEYPDYLELYDNFSHHIMRIDFARFCILHSYGGIYADLDTYCYQNFYNLLRRDLYIVQSWEDWKEKVQNSLMISTPNHQFWEKCMMFSSFTYNKLNSYQFSHKDYILECCGPKMISRILDSSVKFLPKEIFNPTIENQFNWGKNDEEKYENALKDFRSFVEGEKNIFTRHFLTGTWTY